LDRPAVPRTRPEIRKTLRALGVRPSRRLGQSFLADPGALARIAAAAAPEAGDLVLEVGPGLGGLTAALAESGASVLAVEIDRGLAGFLLAAFADEPRVRILEGDALDGHGGLSPALRDELAAAAPRAPSSERPGGPRAAPTETPGAPRGRLLVVSNLPYSAATPLVQALLRREPPPDDMVIMVQREVGDRIRAAPGTAAYGPLSVLVQAVAKTGRLETVRKESFHPVPEVASSVLRITPDPALRAAAGDPGRLAALVHAAFSMRRKTLGNALCRAGVPAAALRAAGVDPGRRAETLSAAEFVALAAALPALPVREAG
jgi:16S rRNA (adenine1518-N6/adenine1519-N6)-dimethyltransferase